MNESEAKMPYRHLTKLEMLQNYFSPNESHWMDVHLNQCVDCSDEYRGEVKKLLDARYNIAKGALESER